MQDGARGGNRIMIFDAPDQRTAEMVCATLQSSGIDAVLQSEYDSPAAGFLNHLVNTDSRGVLVPEDQADAARAILEEPMLTEDELIAAAEEDDMTLEEAEARLRGE